MVTNTFFGSILLTGGSGGKGRGLGQDLVLVGHEGRKAKGLDVLGWGWTFRGGYSLLLQKKAKSTYLSQTRFSLDLSGKLL